MRTPVLLALTLVLTAAVPADAQLTTGTILGRISDEQGAAMPGVSVQASNSATGFVRETVSDEGGGYRLAALPVGVYDVVATLPGFQRFEQVGVTVNIATSVPLDVTLTIARLAESVTVTAPAGLVSTHSSAVGEVVDLARIEGLPLNGRQFANLAATVPGVGLGFHSDVSKSAQYSPQISGGNGRNVNYIVDGGDNNDDTVGGLLQLFPLEAIQEFSVATQRFNAEYGRSNGAVLNVVTKSGTNTLSGSGIGLFRHDSMNARTTSEKIGQLPKQPYDRFQYGGSLGGPIVRDRMHYFAAYERTQQDTTQVVNTLGIYPDQDGVYPIRFRQDLFTSKVTVQPKAGHYLAVRYGRDLNSQPNGAALRHAPSTWSTSTNSFHSLNGNHNWVTGSTALNELVVQYSNFSNEIPPTTLKPILQFPNAVYGGGNISAPQETEQVKWQFRDDLSWTAPGLGLSHEFRTGVNWLHEPRLFTRTAQGTSGIFFMLNNAPNGPVRQVMAIGGTPEANIPIDLIGLYVQDDWRVTPRLTLSLGVRWDYVSGMPLDQSRSANFQAMQEAGRRGRFAGTMLEDFGLEPRSDKDNVQPRFGAAYDLRGDGRDVIRAGWGIYTDFGYTNSNALTASYDASGGAGIVFSAFDAGGLRKPDGSFFLATDDLATIQSLNTVNPNVPPSAGEVVSPRLEQPFTYQTNVGWSHELSASTAIRADYVRVQGRNLNMRVRPNTLVDGRRALADVGVQPNDLTFRAAISRGRSEYDALILGLRRRMSRGVDLNAAYTLARAASDIGSAYDEIAQNLIQDVDEPFAAGQLAPSARTDARHQVSISAIVQAPWQISVAPIFLYRSALPVHTQEGIDLNRDGNNNDKAAMAYRYTGLSDSGAAMYEAVSPCETVNCSRRAPFSQMNLRVSKAFALFGTTRLEVLAEAFNLLNAKNPSFSSTQRRLNSNGTPAAAFMQPNAYAGDLGQPEQRIGQVGFRFSF